MADPSPEMWQAAMRAGIRDLLAPDADVAEIHAAVERAGQAAASRRRVLRPAPRPTATPAGSSPSPRRRAGRQDHRVDQPGPRPDRTRRSRPCWSTSTSSSATAPRRWAWPVRAAGAPSTARPARTRWSSRPSSPSTRAGCTPSAGRSPRPPGHGQRRGRLRLLASLAREFRYVIVDTAPDIRADAGGARPGDRRRDADQHGRPGVRGLRKELDVLRELCLIPAGWYELRTTPRVA